MIQKKSACLFQEPRHQLSLGPVMTNPGFVFWCLGLPGEEELGTISSSSLYSGHTQRDSNLFLVEVILASGQTERSWPLLFCECGRVLKMCGKTNRLTRDTHPVSPFLAVLVSREVTSLLYFQPSACTDAKCPCPRTVWDQKGDWFWFGFLALFLFLEILGFSHACGENHLTDWYYWEQRW